MVYSGSKIMEAFVNSVSGPQSRHYYTKEKVCAQCRNGHHSNCTSLKCVCKKCEDTE